MANPNEKAQQQSIDGTKPEQEGRRGGKESFDIRAELEAFRSELSAEFKKELEGIRAKDAEDFRERMNEEREMMRAQLDASRAEISALRGAQPQRIDVPRLQGGQGPDDVLTPTQRRALRPLPLEGEVTFELTHGSFLGETMDGEYSHEEAAAREATGLLPARRATRGPARPGEVLRFDMTKTAHRRQAQALRDSGCAERV